MRFELNKSYVFFAFQHRFAARTTPIEKAHAYPTTDLDVEIVDVKFINAVCTEHHKVHNSYDDKQEKKYDGFIFEHDNLKARNQYPTAEYGQMDDSGDRRINFLHSYFEKYEQDIDKIIAADVYLDFHLFTNHMESLERGLFKLKENGELELLKKLQARKKMFCDELAKQLNMEIVVTPLRWKKTDGTYIEPDGMFEVNLKELSK